MRRYFAGFVFSYLRRGGFSSKRLGHRYPAALAHTHPRCRSRCLPVAAKLFPRAVCKQAAGYRFTRLNKTAKQADSVLHSSQNIKSCAFKKRVRLTVHNTQTSKRKWQDWLNHSRARAWLSLSLNCFQCVQQRHWSFLHHNIRCSSYNVSWSLQKQRGERLYRYADPCKRVASCGSI